jgi:hypothetical protein
MVLGSSTVTKSSVPLDLCIEFRLTERSILFCLFIDLFPYLSRLALTRTLIWPVKRLGALLIKQLGEFLNLEAWFLVPIPTPVL